jgi:uncharacterized membrane protein YgdD (TMEM256/DUF423 family)
MYERASEPILPFRQWLRRLAWSATLAALLVGAALFAGTVGYHALAGLDWLDAALNAAMILTGMGPVDRLEQPAAKVFAIGYALFSGLVFIGASGLIATPWLHRLLHTLHADEE